jgi:hypothetical protein
MTKNSLTLAVAVAAIASLSAKAQGTVAYDNTTGYENAMTGRGNIELGDEINLTTGPSTLTDFSFEYNYTGAGGASGVLRIYDKTGGGGLAPGNLLFQSDPFTLTTGFHSAAIHNQSIDVPGTLIWTVQFSGLTTATEGGLLFYNGVGVGSGPGQSLDDYWENSNPGGTPNWVVAHNDTVIDNLGSQVIVAAVPEPTTIGLLVGGAAMLGFAARRRKA